MTLSVLVPTPITDAILFSSTVTEADHPAYNPATTYALGDKVISATSHRRYESLRASNTGNDPTLIDNRIGLTPWWADLGPTNRWAMFDDQVSTRTTGTSPLVVVLRPGFFNGLYLAGLIADAIEIVVKDAPGGNVIYDSGVVTLEGSAPEDYYEHFFSPFKPLTDYLVTGLEPYNDAEITITLTSGGTVSVGALLLGDNKPLGKTQHGAKAKPKTYSYIRINERGDNEIIRGKSAKDISLTAWLERSEADAVTETITSILDVPVVLIGTELPGYASLRGYGLVKGEISFDHPENCLLTVELNGLI